MPCKFTENSKTPIQKVVVFGIMLECFLIGILLLGNLRTTVPLFLLLYLSAFLMYLGAVRHCFQLPGDHKGYPEFLPIIIAFAVLFRATLFFSEPSLSEDIYRYLWDGKLINEGFNPYSYVPGSKELVSLRDLEYEMINHKDIGTPYGPLAMMIFALAQRIMDSVYFMKIPFILFDCLSILLILRMLSRSGLSRNNVIVYAWNPLVLMEVAGSGHSDSLGVLILLATIYSVQLSKSWVASIGFAFAFLAKYFALLFLPAILKHLRKTDWILTAIILVAGFLPFAEHLETHILNIIAVGSAWQFNDSIFSLLVFITRSLYLSKLIVIAILVLLAAIVWRSQWPPVKSAMVMIGGTLMLTTTVQPWYLLWLIPFLCFSLNRAWLLLTGLVMLSYHVLIIYDAEGVWEENLWVKLAIYTPFYFLLLGDALRGLHTRLTRRAHT